MLFKTIFLTALAAYQAAAQRACGTAEPTEEEIAIAKQFYQIEQEARLAGNATSALATIDVNVYFHVLATSTSASGGYLTVSAFSQSASPGSFPPLTNFTMADFREPNNSRPKSALR